MVNGGKQKKFVALNEDAEFGDNFLSWIATNKFVKQSVAADALSRAKRAERLIGLPLSQIVAELQAGRQDITYVDKLLADSIPPTSRKPQIKAELLRALKLYFEFARSGR